MMAYAYNPGRLRQEDQVQGQPWLPVQFKASLSYRKPWEGTRGSRGGRELIATV